MCRRRMAAADEHDAVVIAGAMQGNESALQARGADIGVANLREISIDGDNAEHPGPALSAGAG